MAETLKTIIEDVINNIEAFYFKQPKTETIWVKIKVTAVDLSYFFYRNGKLLGTQNKQAYSIKMGLETIIEANIANRKIIL